MMNILFGFLGLSSLISYGALMGALVMDRFNVGPEKYRKGILFKRLVTFAVSFAALLIMDTMGYSNGLLQYLPEWVRELP